MGKDVEYSDINSDYYFYFIDWRLLMNFCFENLYIVVVFIC